MPFKDKVYEIAKQIPPGKVATYGQLARLAGQPKAARAVGVFMATNPYAPTVPCHRVIASTGELTGFSAPGGLVKKKQMLVREGVIFKGSRVDLLRSLWQK